MDYTLAGLQHLIMGVRLQSYGPKEHEVTVYME